jgi:hypothetical protein
LLGSHGSMGGGASLEADPSPDPLPANSRVDVIVSLLLSRANRDLIVVNATSTGQGHSESVCTAD